MSQVYALGQALSPLRGKEEVVLYVYAVLPTIIEELKYSTNPHL